MCIVSSASKLQASTFLNHHLVCKVSFYEKRYFSNGTSTSNMWMIKMKIPNIKKSAHVAFKMDDNGCYYVDAIKQNDFPDVLFNSIIDELLKESN